MYQAPSPLAVPDLARWLITCPAFLGMSLDAATRLATYLRVRAYNRECMFPPTQMDLGDQPLRIIWAGTVAWTVVGGENPMRAPLRAGMLIGSSSVHGWANEGRPCPLDPAIVAEVLTTTLDPTVVYELMPEDFGAALGRDPAADPLRAVLASAHRGAWAGPALRALSNLDELSEMRVDQLTAIFQRGQIQVVAGGELIPGLEAESSPSCLCAQLDGLVQRIVPQDGGSTIEQSWGIARPGAILGGSELFDEAPLLWNARALETVHVLSIPRDAVAAAPTSIPGWLRSVREAVGMPAIYRTGQRPMQSASWWVVVPAADITGIPLWAAVESLANAAAERLRDNVLVLHLDALAPRPPIDPPDPAGPSMRHTRIALADLDAATLASLLHEPWDLVLVDPGAAARDAKTLREVLHTLATLPVAFRATGLFSRREDWEPMLDLLPTSMRTSALPTRIARGDGRGGSGSSLLSELRARVRQKVPGFAILGAPARWAWRGAETSAALVRDAVVDEVAFFGQGTTKLSPAHPALPVGTARIFLTDALAQVVLHAEEGRFPDNLDPATRAALLDAFGYWARGVTRRRVGVALGGAGALSYTGAAMLLALRQKGVPIDAISGTSFGSVVGAFYAVEGEAGLHRLPTLWPSLLTALFSTSASTLPLSAWATCQLGDVPLDSLQLQLLPVGTVASTLQEWDVRGGTVSRGLRVSGSLPPFAPTILGRLRLLDGGYATDVPCQVLTDEGCDLVIAVNPYPMPAPRKSHLPWIPFVTKCLQEVDPWLRMSDSMRCYQLLWRYAAGRQDGLADVVYSAEDAGTMPMAFWAGDQIVEDALRSDELCDAAEDAAEQWMSMIGTPRSGVVGNPGGVPSGDAAARDGAAHAPDPTLPASDGA